MKPFALSLIAALTVALSPAVLAVNYDWTNASGVDSNWLTPANWNPAGPAQGGNGNNAQFIIGATGPANITADVPDVQDYLFANDGSVGVRQVNHSAGIGNVLGWTRMGISGAGDAGTYNMTGGQLNMGSFKIAENAGTSATLAVSGGVFRQNDVADPGDGNAWPRIAQGGNATVNLSGTGIISADSRLVMGAGGTVTINQTGGTFEVRRGEYTLGDGYPTPSATPNATHNISAGTLQALSTLDNGDTGGNITVAQWGNANAVLTVSGTATVRANRDILIADVDPAPAGANASAKGEIVQSGGTVSYGRGFVAGRARSGANFGDGTYTLSGGTLMQDTVDPENGINWNHIGQAGTGTFNISGSGVASFNARTHLGSNAGGIGVVNQTGGVFEVRNHELIIGDTGTGTYNISAGTVQTLGAGREFNVGHWNNSVGNLNVSGTAQVIAGANMNLGNGDVNPNGTVTQTGGSVTVTGNLGLANVATGTGVYNLNGGVLNMTGGNITRGPGTGIFNFTGGRLQDVANINNLDLTQQGGTLAPGPSGGTGTTTINGTYSLNATGILELNIEVATFDQLIATGTVTLAGNLDLVPGAGLTNGQTFLIVSNNSALPVAGTFAGRPDDTLFFENGATWSIDYQGGDGNDVLLTHVVPEPGSAGLIIAGLLCGALRRRRRQSV